MGFIAALALAVVFAWAAVVKLRDLPRTRRSFAALGLRPARHLAVLIPCFELATAGALLFVPTWGAFAAIGLLCAFSALLVRVLVDGRTVACGCFGGTGAEPVGPQDIVRNLGLLLGAVVALWATPGAWSLPAILTVGAAGTILLMVHALVRLRGEVGVVWDNTLAGEPVAQ